jgi:ribosome-binding protein aMBF1 (putative translation factor)
MSSEGTRNERREEVKTMVEKEIERRRQISAIKKVARSLNGGRSYLLQGRVWACRQAAGLTQRQLAETMGSSQTTVRKLERLSRGAYPKTIRRLCEVLGLIPQDLLCGDSDELEELEEEARR